MYNQNASAAGVTANCGGEIPTPLPAVRPPPSRGFRNFPLTSTPPRVTRTDCGSEVVLRPGDIVICRECGYRILYKKRRNRVRPGSPTLLFCFPFSPLPGASVFGATALRTDLTVPSPIAPPQSSIRGAMNVITSRERVLG